METIEKKIEQISAISVKYEALKEELNENQTQIVQVFKDLIDRYADDFDLTKENSVRKLKFYTVVCRVKEKQSFSEKLIRNNDYNRFSNVVFDDATPLDDEIVARFKDIDDLIGIKVLTDLNVDTSNMFKLISSSKFINDASNAGIAINSQDIEVQPVKMKNGLDIYKLRCNYQTWNFELQIKSKLESAWGDMEHAIFYKDYKITPVRDLAQQSMNHIGRLLKQIDDFLEEIRDANDNFELNSKVILFINKFERIYANQISQALSGINYNFKKIASLTYNIETTEPFVLEESVLSTEHLSLHSSRYSQYIDYRNSDFDLQIFESIVISGKALQVNAENIGDVLDLYFQLIKTSYVNFILINKVVQENELAERYVNLHFDACIAFNCREYILNTNNVLGHINNLKSIEELTEVLGLEDARIINLLKAYSVYCFNGNLTDFLELTDKEQLLIDLESSRGEIQKVKEVEKNLMDSISTLINIIG